VISLILQVYLEGIVISAFLVLGLSLLYLILAYIGQDKRAKARRRNIFFDLAVIDLLTIPVVAFAVMAVLIMIRARQ